DRFRLLGYQPDAIRYIAAGDLFVLASRHEGMPVAVMEALALGVPVVAPAVGGLNDAVTADVGLLVEPASAASLARGIEVLLDPAARAARSAAARESARRFEI